MSLFPLITDINGFFEIPPPPLRLVYFDPPLPSLLNLRKISDPPVYFGPPFIRRL